MGSLGANGKRLAVGGYEKGIRTFNPDGRGIRYIEGLDPSWQPLPRPR